MHRFVMTAAIAFGSVGPVLAESKVVDCELTVRGKTYIKGACQFDSSSGGNFKILGDNNYFAQVDITSAGVAQGSWNEDPNSTHAHTPLGTLKREGACWVSAQAKVCARALSPAAEKAALARQPGGEGLFPEVASQSCLGVEGELKAGARLVLHNCRIPTDLIFVKRKDGTLGVSKRDDLCLDLESSGGSKPPRLVVQTCQPASLRWTTKATGVEAAPVQSSAGTCLSIPQLDSPDARFPFAVNVSPCAAADSRAVRFILSKG